MPEHLGLCSSDRLSLLHFNAFLLAAHAVIPFIFLFLHLFKFLSVQYGLLTCTFELLHLPSYSACCTPSQISFLADFRVPTYTCCAYCEDAVDLRLTLPLTRMLYRLLTSKLYIGLYSRCHIVILIIQCTGPLPFRSVKHLVC